MGAARIGLAILALAGASSAALAQDSNVSLGVTAGVGGFYFPDMTSGVSASNTNAFDSDFSGSAFGPSLALSGSVTLDPFNGLDAAIGWSGFATMGHIGYSGTESFSGPGVVVIPGITLPGNSTISLTTSSGGGLASANSTITNNNPEGGSANPISDQPVAGGVGNVVAVTPSAGNNSFAYAATTADGPNNAAAAYAAIGASDGGIFIGAGDLTGLKIYTDFSMDVIYTGADVSLALSGVVNDKTAVQVYAGPSYRYLSQSGSSKLTVDIPEATPTAVIFPEYIMEGNGDLKSHYLGGVVGANVSYIVGPNLIFTLGGEGGLYYVNDHLTGSESYTVQGGDDGAGVPYGPQTVANSGISIDSDGLAWSGKVNGIFTIALAPARQLSFGGSVEYLSRVASLRGSPALDSNTYHAGSGIGSATWSSGGGSSISYGSMWNFTGTVSLTGQF